MNSTKPPKPNFTWKNALTNMLRPKGLQRLELCGV